MGNLMTVIGAIVIATGIFFAGIAHTCDTTGKFKTPWWSGQQTTYLCIKE